MQGKGLAPSLSPRRRDSREIAPPRGAWKPNYRKTSRPRITQGFDERAPAKKVSYDVSLRRHPCSLLVQMQLVELREATLVDAAHAVGTGTTSLGDVLSRRVVDEGKNVREGNPDAPGEVEEGEYARAFSHELEDVDREGP